MFYSFRISRVRSEERSVIWVIQKSLMLKLRIFELYWNPGPFKNATIRIFLSIKLSDSHKSCVSCQPMVGRHMKNERRPWDFFSELIEPYENDGFPMPLWIKLSTKFMWKQLGEGMSNPSFVSVYSSGLPKEPIRPFTSNLKLFVLIMIIIHWIEEVHVLASTS